VLRRIQITGVGGIPRDARAISANVTGNGAAADGYLTVWDCATKRPAVSTLNFSAGETVPNGAFIRLDASGGFCAYSSATTDLLVDINGYFAGSADGRFSPVTPTRLMDSRIAVGAPARLGAGSTTALAVTGVAGVPNGATMVALNVTSVAPGLAGFVTVFACDAPQPAVSSLNPEPGETRPNLVIAPVAADGTVCFYTLTDVDLVVDITGFMSPSATQNFWPTTPFRLADTRASGSMQRGEVRVIQVAGVNGVPAGATAVSANFAATGASAPGYVSAWPCGAQPTTSVLNFEAGGAIANGAELPLSAAGTICVYVSSDVDVIVDVNGWWQ